MIGRQNPRSNHLFLYIRHSFAAFIVIILYHICLFSYLLVIDLETLFEQDLLKKTDPIYELMVNQGDELLSLTFKLIKQGLFISLIVLSVAVLFYLITFTKQTLMMDKESLRIKILLGASNSRVTLEHLRDYVSPFLVGYLGSFGCCVYLLVTLYQSSETFLGLNRLDLSSIWLQGSIISLVGVVILVPLTYLFTDNQIKRMTD